MFYLLISSIAQIQGNLRGRGIIGLEGKSAADLAKGVGGTFENLVTGIVGVLTAAGVLWFLIQFIVGAYALMTAGGNAEKIGAAQMKITNAIVGLVVLLAALVIVSLIGFLLGFDLILDLQSQINSISNFGE